MDTEVELRLLAVNSSQGANLVSQTLLPEVVRNFHGRFEEFM